MVTDKNGNEIKKGDIVTVTVKYYVDYVYPDGNLLAHKVYDLPASAATVFDSSFAPSRSVDNAFVPDSVEITK